MKKDFFEIQKGSASGLGTQFFKNFDYTFNSTKFNPFARGDECEPFECPENMVWSTESGCGPFCDQNIVCDMLPYPYPACVCQSGFLEDGLGNCVPEKLCFCETVCGQDERNCNIQCEVRPCEENEEFNSCGGCDALCMDPNRPCPELGVTVCTIITYYKPYQVNETK